MAKTFNVSERTIADLLFTDNAHDTHNTHDTHHTHNDHEGHEAHDTHNLTEKLTRRISLLVSPAQYKLIKKAASSEELDVNTYIRNLITDDLKKEGLIK